MVDRSNQLAKKLQQSRHDCTVCDTIIVLLNSHKTYNKIHIISEVLILISFQATSFYILLYMSLWEFWKQDYHIRLFSGDCESTFLNHRTKSKPCLSPELTGELVAYGKILPYYCTLCSDPHRSQN